MEKKDFMPEAGSALSNFMTPPKKAQPAQDLQEQEEQPKATYRKQDIQLETKSRHVQVLMYPSIYNELKRRADANNTTVNNYLNTILLNLFEEEQ